MPAACTQEDDRYAEQCFWNPHDFLTTAVLATSFGPFGPFLVFRVLPVGLVRRALVLVRCLLMRRGDMGDTDDWRETSSHKAGECKERHAEVGISSPIYVAERVHLASVCKRRE